MIQLVDLHTHSSMSDGQYRPSELVHLAKEHGIEVLALTDHDTLSGLEEAITAGKALGIRVLSGVELSAREYPTFHILGYGFSPDAPQLLAMCEDMRQRRNARTERLLSFLREKGISLCAEEVAAAAGGDVIGRPHFARVMLEHGFISSYRDAFNLYLDTDEYHQKVEQNKPSVRQCLETIKAAGGKTSLAHPYQIGIDDDALDAQVRNLIEYGLDAIECYYPKHTAEQTAFYLHLADKYGLHITGGSDFHGERVKPEIQLSALEMEIGWLLEK